MVFQTIGLLLLAAAIPLWLYRWFVYNGLTARERKVFRHLVSNRNQSGIRFALEVFCYLLTLAIAAILLVYALAYVKGGTFDFGTYKSHFRAPYYSGIEPVDQVVDAFHYNQILPLAALNIIILLSVSFALVMTAIRDIVLIRRLKRKLRRLMR